MESLEDEDGVAQINLVCGVLDIGEARPVLRGDELG
jgi:hypothetical protein